MSQSKRYIIGSEEIKATTLGANQPFRYRGYIYDAETGWYYLQSRYYDPTTCRFISADVLLSTGQGVLGHNAFAYCLNNPVNMVDDGGNICRPYKTWNETWTDDEHAGGEHKYDKHYCPWLIGCSDYEHGGYFYIPVIGVCARGSFGWSVSASAGISLSEDLSGFSLNVGGGSCGLSAGIYLMFVAVPSEDALDDCQCVFTGGTLLFFGFDYVMFYDDDGNQYHGIALSLNIPIAGLPVEFHGEVSLLS